MLPESATLERLTAATPEAMALLAALDQALAGPYSPDQHHALSVEQLFQPHIRFYIARRDGQAVGCGGVALLDGYAELKRMYAQPAVRGQGVMRMLLKRLEAEARDAGFILLRIETGNAQHEAIRFYERAGYYRRDAFGPYAAMPANAIATSIFYEKTL